MSVLVVLTGGTIGSRVEDKIIDVNEASAYRLIGLYEERYGKNVEFDVIQPLTILSENLKPQHLKVLCDCLDRVDMNRYEGIIVTHGSDTLAYTSAMLGYCYRQTKIPIVLIASNYELTDERSNGLDNFYNAVCFIREKKVKGVFTIFQNNKKENIVYLATRLVEADTYLDQFSSYGKIDFGRMINGRFERCDSRQNPSIEELNTAKDKVVIRKPETQKEIVLIHPYPGLNYSHISLDDNVGAVLHCLYHSATACSGKGNYSAVEFIRKCTEKGIETYVSSFKQEENDLYATSIDILEAGAIPLRNISTEAALAKLTLAYNQQLYEPKEFMKKNLFYEILPTVGEECNWDGK